MKISGHSTPPAKPFGAVRGACVLGALCALCLSIGIAAPRADAVEPAPGLAASAVFNVANARVGDTVQYFLRVEWNEAPAALRVLPPEQLETQGFRVLGFGVLHRQIVLPGETRNATEFSYQLVATEPGTARVAAFALRYHDGLTNRDAFLGVPDRFLEVAPAVKPWWRRPLVSGAIAVLLFAGIGGAAAALRRRKSRKAATAAPALSREAAALKMLKSRWDAADSRRWLGDAEDLCLEFLCGRLGAAKTGSVRFEAALDQYLQRHPAAPGEAEGWNRLRDLFHEARYAAARKEPHELRDAYRHLKTCLQLQGEPEP